MQIGSKIDVHLIVMRVNYLGVPRFHLSAGCDNFPSEGDLIHARGGVYPMISI